MISHSPADDAVTEVPMDVLIVGAGLAGAAAAAVLGNMGRRVAIVDPQPACKPTFKAEKIEPDQADLLRRLGLFDGVRPHVAPIATVTEAHLGLRIHTRAIDQYGMRYWDVVNAVRRQIPASVQQHEARVTTLDTGPHTQRVGLSSGVQVNARLVILATGTGSERLIDGLQFRRRMLRVAQSLCTGFDIERRDGARFPFDSLVCRPDSVAGNIGYIACFPVPGAFRVNLFSFRLPNDPWVNAMARDPEAEVGRVLPRLARVTGPWRATSKVETRSIDLYVTEAPARDGVVLLGDAFQSVCPSSGTGLSKVLVDVDRLCTHYLPAWLATPGMTADKIGAYYADAAKVASDSKSLSWAEHERDFATNRSLRWWLHRRRTFANAMFGGLRARMAGATPQPSA